MQTLKLRKGLKLKLRSGFAGSSNSVNVDIIDHSIDNHGEEMIRVRFPATATLYGPKLEAFRSMIEGIRETRPRPGAPEFEIEIADNGNLKAA